MSGGGGHGRLLAGGRVGERGACFGSCNIKVSFTAESFGDSALQGVTMVWELGFTRGETEKHNSC